MKKFLTILMVLVISVMTIPTAVVFASGPDNGGITDTYGTMYLDNKNPDTWARIADGRYGVLTYNGGAVGVGGPTFNFTMTAFGLEGSTEYSLIYFANPYPGNFPGALIGTGSSAGDGSLTIVGPVNLGMNLPTDPDTNKIVDHSVAPDFYAPGFRLGAKIWLVPSDCYNGTTNAITVWTPTRFLFETGLINYTDTDKTIAGGSDSVGLLVTITEPIPSVCVTVDSDDPINFGSVMIGSWSSEDKAIVLHNCGTVPVKITTLVSSGFYTDCMYLTLASPYTIKAKDWTYSSIPAGGSITVYAKVLPTAAYATASISGVITFLAESL